MCTDRRVALSKSFAYNIPPPLWKEEIVFKNRIHIKKISLVFFFLCFEQFNRDAEAHKMTSCV